MSALSFARQQHARWNIAVRAIVGSLSLCALMWALRHDLNPDWYGYERIYSEGGSWLAEQGRDPLFLALTSAISSLLGPSGYEAFRYTVGLYFALFMYQLLRGHVLALGASQHRWPLLLLGIAPLAATRFTVQMREGLAITLVFIAMASLQRRPASSALGLPARRCFSLFALGLASAIHSGTLTVLIAWLLAYSAESCGRHSISVELERLKALTIISLGTACLIGIYFSDQGGGALTVNEFYGWLAESELTVSMGKYAYWFVYGVGIVIVRTRLLQLYVSGLIEQRLRVLLGVLGLAFLPAIYTASIILLVMGAPSITISTAARTMNMLLSLLLAFLVLRGRLTRPGALFALFILFDQARIVYEAILTTFGEVS